MKVANRIKANEEFYSPEAVMTYSGEGLSKMSQNFHNHVRNNIIEKEFALREHPIVLNSWEGYFLDVNEKVKGDLEFQQALVKAYSEYMMDNLAIDKNEDSYKELEIIFLSALKIAFNFRDAENIKLNIKEN